MRRAGFIAFGCALLASAPAFASAQVMPSGKVSLNHGQGFAEIEVPTLAQPGDSVIAGPNSSARIVYSNGCEVEVTPGTVAIVADHDPFPCKPAALPGGASFSRSGYLIAGAVVAGAAVAAVAIANGGNSDNDGGGGAKPASP